MLYSIDGASGASGIYPYPRCLVPKRSVTAIPADLLQDLNISTIESLPIQPDIICLCGRNSNGKVKEPSKFNMFRVLLGSDTNLDEPRLHVRLEIVNKIVQSIDEFCTNLEEETKWSLMASEKYNRFRLHFTNELNKMGDRRARYNDGQLSGQLCESFEENMPTFCTLFLLRMSTTWYRFITISSC